MSIYSHTVQSWDGSDVPLADYKGKVLLIVNSATDCGFTPQYTELQELYDRYQNQGFEILDFPCNQFGNQASGSETEIHNFCTARFAITFPQFAKIDVNGPNESPLYTELKKQKGSLLGANIKWNFTKFLIDQEGNVVKRYGPADKPSKIEKELQLLLK